MSQRVVLITGCTTGGIGSSLVEEFARRGCKVYSTARNVDSMTSFGNDDLEKNIVRRALDVTNPDSINTVVTEIVEKEGKLDIVVNNAGVLGIGPVIDLDIDKVKAVFEANTISIIRMSKAVVPHMAKAKSGLIINIGSIAGNIPSAWNGLYSASKAAMHAISDALSMELTPFNIKVLLVAPGGVRSNISNNAASTFSLPPNSLYTSFLNNIIARMYASQGPNATPREKFARDVVNRAFKANPGVYMTTGSYSTLSWFMEWLPKSVIQWIVWGKLPKPMGAVDPKRVTF